MGEGGTDGRSPDVTDEALPEKFYAFIFCFWFILRETTLLPVKE